MNNQAKHLIFFDSNCPLCRSSIKKIIQIDRNGIFCFAPLDGITANKFFKGKYQKLLDVNSLFLVENFLKRSKKYWIRSRGFFRILWLIGRWYKILGVMYFLPAFLTDWIYKIIAKHRHQFFTKEDTRPYLTKVKDRLLP